MNVGVGLFTQYPECTTARFNNACIGAGFILSNIKNEESFLLFLLFFATSSIARDAHMPDVPVEDDELFWVNQFHSPAHMFIKPRHDFIGVYYRGIERVYSSTTPEFGNFLIKETFWHLRKDLNLTCWLNNKDGKWQVISYIFWPPGANF